MKTLLKNLFSFALVYFLLFHSANSQVKVGSNPTTINSNSLLELESTTKGFLPPRVAIGSLSAVSPLTGTVPEGMVVYSDGGAVADGLYYWTGSQWVRMTTSANDRANYVLVKSAADFPAPVSGVITLAANTIYEINGTIVLTSKIDLNNSSIIGLDGVNDMLVYTPSSGELFTGTHGGTIRFLTMMAANGTAKVFNLDAGGAYYNLVIVNSNVYGSYNVGLVKGFSGSVYLETVGFQLNMNGIIYQNITNLVLNNTLWDISNHNTFETYTGTFSVIQKINGGFGAYAANSATAMNVSGITSIGAGDLKTVFFVGDGTKVTGTFSSVWEVESVGLALQKDDEAAGNVYITTSATTYIAAINTPVKIAGTTAAGELFRVTSPQNNRLTYTGAKTRFFHVISSLSLTSAATDKYFTFYVYKNGVKINASRQSLKLAAGADKGSVTLSCAVSLATNDYIEVWVENDTDDSNLTVESMNLSIK